MVWGGICTRGKTLLVFLVKGVKINQKLYQWDILEVVVLLYAKKHFGNVNFVSTILKTSSTEGQKNTKVVEGAFFRHDIV